MTTRQPIWKLAGQIGDVNPLDYSGGFVYVDSTGVYPPELEWIESEDQHKAEPSRWTVSRIVLDRCTVYNGQLIPFGFDTRSDLPHPIQSYVEWFSSDLTSVAESCDIPVSELRSMLCSSEPMELALGYLQLAMHHGWLNFDEYPLTFTNREEVEKRNPR